MTTSDLLKTASAIAARLEHRGESITTTEAIARAESVREKMADLKALLSEQAA